jgi:DNA-binding MarR family transcriptional regulator
VLRAILDLIATNDDPMTQSELARQLRMTQGAVRTNLKELEHIGLLHQRDRRYYYTDAILRYWVAYVQHGIEVSEFPGERDLAAIMAELDRKYQQAATELGQSREELVRGLMRRFAGQLVAGELFGVGGEVQLPCFSIVDSYISADGTVEIDAIGKGETPWGVEVKWKGKATGRKELEALVGKTGAMSLKLWYVSKAGFTAGAREYATDAGILLSGEADLQRLGAMV